MVPVPGSLLGWAVANLTSHAAIRPSLAVVGLEAESEKWDRFLPNDSEVVLDRIVGIATSEVQGNSNIY